MTGAAEQEREPMALRRLRATRNYLLQLVMTTGACFAAARLDATVADLYAVATPISVTAGVALAAMLLGGFRTWPAVFVGILAAGIPLGSDAWSLSALGTAAAAALPATIAQTVEAAGARWLISLRPAHGSLFDGAAGVARFAGAIVPAAALAPCAGLAAVRLAGYAEWDDFLAQWAAWSLRDAAGLLVVTPPLVLWAMPDLRTRGAKNILASSAVFALALAIGVPAFGPLYAPGPYAVPLAFACLLPLALAALGRNRRDTATVVLVLSACATWGALAARGPFAPTADVALLPFLPLIAFMIAASVVALAASAELIARERRQVLVRRQEENVHALFAAAPAGLAQADAGGRFTVANDQFCRVLRRPPAEVLRMHLADLVHFGDRPRLLGLEHAAQPGQSFVIESTYTPSNGAAARLSTSVSAVADLAGGARRFVVTTEDVTARRKAETEQRRTRDELARLLGRSTEALEQSNAMLAAETDNRKNIEALLEHQVRERQNAEQALAAAERRFRLFVQGIRDYAMFMLGPDGCVMEWNAGAQRMLGYTGAEILDQHFSRFYLEEEQQRGEPARALQVAAYEGSYVADGWRVRRDDSRLWASVAIEAIRDEAGTLVGFAHIARDITERREAQRTLERAQQQLAQSQKMEALGQLTGSIAHDFNNLLMIVSGHAQLLRRRLSEPKHLQAVDAVYAAANRGESLTRQLLAFSRRQPLNPVVINPKERIEAVREMLVGSLRGNIALTCDMPEEVWRLEVDIAELELALVNLTVNARDAMPGGGSITLSATNVVLTKADEVDGLEGDFVAITMTDTGVGIAPDVLPRIFEPFYTTKEFGKGTGLGLSQVYGFSRQSGGTVVAASTVGIGTSITLYLPRSHAELVESAKPALVLSDAPAQGTILVVEDNYEVAEITASLVEQLGYQAVRAENAGEALSTLRHGAKVDLVLSDVVMPGSMNGFALAQEIRNHYADIPVLLTSGYSDVVQAASPRLPILRKPFQLAALGSAIREALDLGGPEATGRVVQFSQARGTAGSTAGRMA